MSQEETNLATHVEICAIRYKGIEEKMEDLDKRLTKMEDKVSSIKTSMESGFADIKLLLEKQSNARTIQLIATAGTIGAAVVALVGYIYTH
jgi:predicted  nucleic acid-binding Zn-ribbon protein